MECARIRERLSEYIDGALDAQAKEELEQHLRTCQACQGELAALRAVVDQLGSMEPVEAPGDFLESLHRRMESGFTLDKLVRIVFRPMRVKIPLQFAAATAVAVLVFALFHTTQEEKLTGRVSDVPQSVMLAKKEKLEPTPSLAGKKAQPPGAAFEEAGEEPSKTAKPIELALVIDEMKGDKGAYAPSAAMEGKTLAEADREPSREERTSAAPPPESDEAWRVAAPSPLNRVLSQVRALVEGVGGKVISVHGEGQTERPLPISVEIPADNYPAFTAALERLGTLQATPPTPPGKDRETISVRISLVTPD